MLAASGRSVVTGPSPRNAVPRTWPAFLALAVVALLSAGSLVVERAINGKTAERTSALVEDAMRSIALADDLGATTYRLTASG